MIHTEHNGLGGGTSVKQTLVSPMHTIDVTETSTGHEIEVAQTIIDKIDGKQDKIIVGGFQTNALYSMSFVERENVNPPNPNILPRRIGYYVPLLEIQSINLGKSQFEFSLFSREDGMTYYGRYLFCSHNGNVKFELLDYCQDQQFINPPSFTPNNVVAFKIYSDGQFDRYLICKKVISTGGSAALDAYFFNILSQDIGFCYSKKFYSRNQQVYFTPEEFVHISTDYLDWEWYWNNTCDTLQKEYAIQGDVNYKHSVTLNDCLMYTPTPSIIKPITFNEFDPNDEKKYYGLEPIKIETKNYYIDGIEGLNQYWEDKYKTINMDGAIYTGDELSQYSWNNFSYVNFSTIDPSKCYWVFRAARSGLTQFGFIIETPTPQNY